MTSHFTKLLVTAVIVPVCWAGIQPGNTRPDVTLPHPTGDIYTPPPAGGPESANLQHILDYIYQCEGCVNAHTDQQPYSLWTPGTLPPTLAPVLAFEFSSSAAITEFGMWALAGDDTPILAPVFKGAAAPPVDPDDFATNATVTWNTAGTKVKVTGDPNSVYNNAVYNIPIGAFGFYIKSGANYWFSDDELNSNSPQMLAYLGGNGSSSAGAWTLAYEDAAFKNSDKDFNDFVVKIESMAAVPEPSTVLLLATALLVLVKFVRVRAA
jgi:hypothetical protein